MASGLNGRATASGPGGKAFARGVGGIASAYGTNGYAHAAAHAYSAFSAAAGLGGTITITYEKSGLNRVVTGYVGENGIEPDTTYVVKDDNLVLKPLLYQG